MMILAGIVTVVGMFVVGLGLFNLIGLFQDFSLYEDNEIEKPSKFAFLIPLVSFGIGGLLIWLGFVVINPGPPTTVYTIQW